MDFAIFAPGSAQRLQTVSYLGGGAIRFDTSGRLWLDAIGELDAYTTSGAQTGHLWGLNGSMMSFGPDDTLYVSTVSSLDAYRLSPDLTAQRSRSIPTAAHFSCSADGDAAGTIYIAACETAPMPTGRVWFGVFAYPSGSAAATIVNPGAQGPLTVAPDGSVLAVYGSAVGVWPPNGFSSGAPPRTISLPSQNLRVGDIAADRSGGIYVSAGTYGTPGTLLYAAPGTNTATVLLSTGIGYVTTVP